MSDIGTVRAVVYVEPLDMSIAGAPLRQETVERIGRTPPQPSPAARALVDDRATR